MRELLNRPGNNAEMDKRLHWLLEVGQQALREGNAAEALRAVHEAQPLLSRGSSPTAAEFEKLEKLAQPGP